MKPSLVSNYIILWIHLITISLRMFYEESLDKNKFFKLNLEDINTHLNNIFSSEYIFDNGIIDILPLFTLAGSFYLGRNYPESIIFLFISTLLVEVLMIYNDKPGRLITFMLFTFGAYLLGKFTKTDRNTYLLEKSRANKHILEDPNIQEYETYKLY